MEDLATVLRTLQLYAHQAHNYAKGVSFFADHDFLGDLYKEYEDEFDSVVERMIGLEIPLDIQLINKKSADKLPSDSSLNTKECFQMILNTEKKMCLIIQRINKSSTIGTQQLIGNIADKSEMRQYKIKRRLLD